MATTSTHRDPRSVVTPDAFDVSTELLGLPLAPPGPRLAAILIDLAVIGVVTLVTQRFALILGVVAAVVFVRAAFKRTSVRGGVFGRAMRASVGCLGVFIAIITAALWFGSRLDVRVEGDDEGDVTASLVVPSGSGVGGVLGRVASFAAAAAFEEAETLEEAEDAARSMIEVGDQMGIGRADLRGVLLEAVPEGSEWADDAPELIDRLLLPATEAIESRDTSAIRDEVSLYTTEEALEAYAALRRSGRTGEMDRARLRTLESRLATELASDTLGVLEERVAELEDESASQRQDLARTEEALGDATSGGLFAWLREFVDELGFGFGWATLYLTVMLSWWNGQTIGKRIMRVRVRRLDGEPITWWVAFERAGGYAAGFATGLLGFAQIYWDANRQAIHDRIVGTVVVREGAEKVLDWESAL